MRIGLKTVIFLGGAVLMLAPGLTAGTMFTDAFQQRAETANASRLRVLGELAADQLARRMHQLWRGVAGMSRQVDMYAPEEMRR